jgi:NAD(P)-dependent dehydrogenase (short-subunit alcohol dehydrogenase family)
MTGSELDLSGRHLVVLGASSGIGRAVGLHAIRAGATVLLVGRRVDRLEEARAKAGGGEVCPVDVAKPEGIKTLAAEVSRMGPIDAMVSTVGTARLKLLEHMTEADWQAVLDTNLVGVNSAIRAAVPSLVDGGVVLALSSETVSMPRWALAAYAASKAALEVSLAGWRLEYPRIRFGSVGVGATIPTEFGQDFEDGILERALEIWTRHGQAQEGFMDRDEVGEFLARLLASLLPFPGINLEHVVLRTPSPVTGSSELMKGAAAAGGQTSR